MGKEEEIIEKIKSSKKIPKELKKKMLSVIGDCAISAIITYAYFIFLTLGVKNIHETIYLTDLKVFAVSLGIITVIFFEMAYKKKSRKNIYRGIETLIMAILTLFVQYIILYLTPNYRILIPILGVAYNVYYIFKASAMCINIKKAYKKEQNDIKEIVKKEKKND